jgi:hypothetical protein
MNQSLNLQKPVTLGLLPSFGFGDRIGLATPGHVQAMRKSGAGIAPIFPQQSIREMGRTARSPEGVMVDALTGAHVTGWEGLTGADADHLKTPEDVDRTATAGFTFFTIDPSEHVDQQADQYDDKELAEKFDGIEGGIEWVDAYIGQEKTLPSGAVITFDARAVKRAAVKYGLALREAIKLAAYIREKCGSLGQAFELEISVDETDQPTTLVEHYIVADQCRSNDVGLVSLAPRFIGELEKGVDYIGDVDAFERSVADHAGIAEMLGPYKLSLLSGSDKISIYTAFARATSGRFHVKTAGTSYLEALRVAAREDAELFQRICEFARTRYDADRATYHVHATLDAVPSPAACKNVGEMERVYLECWDDVPEGKGFTEAGRQILHCTFGSVLTDGGLGPAVRQCLEKHPSTYADLLSEHFCRHLDALRAGMPDFNETTG